MLQRFRHRLYHGSRRSATLTEHRTQTSSSGAEAPLHGHRQPALDRLSSHDRSQTESTRLGGASSTINFDGGTLQAYSTNAGASFLNGLDNAFVYGGGLTINNSTGTAITIAQVLKAPVGYGIGADGSTITVVGGGSGYIAPPVVTFAAPASGVQATGVAIINSSGTVTGIIITSPGSNYTAGQSVAVTFNTGTAADNAYVSAATFASVFANTLNTSGGLTFTGTGSTTLSMTNTYTGGTIVNAGTLALGTGGTLGATTGPLAANNTNSTGAGTAVVLTLATAATTTTGSLSGTIATPTSGTNTVTINIQSGELFTVNRRRPAPMPA